MTAPPEQDVEPVEDSGPQVGEPNSNDEAPIRFPVLALESFDTSDGRFLQADSLSTRAFPISLLAVAESPHGGRDSAAAVIVGRITGATRVPGPDVVSKRTNEPFPEGSYVWAADGMISTTAEVPVGNRSVNAYELVKSGRLRGVSVDLAGMDFEEVGEATFDADNPRRRLIVHSAEIAAATLVPIPAFADAYAELPDEQADLAPPAPAALAASAFPAWRSAEVGDYPALTAAAIPDGPMVLVRWPANAADVIAEWIAEGEGEPRDAQALAQHIADQVQANWAPDAEDDPDDELAAPVVAAADSAFAGHDLIFYKNRSTPKVVSRGAKAPDVPDSYGPVVSRRKATAEEEKTIARGDWVRVDSSGKRPGESGYDKSKVRPNLSADLDEPGGQVGMGMPDAPQDCQFGDHPAVKALLFDDNALYLPVCADDEQQGRDLIAQNGATVTSVVDIPDEQPASNQEDVR